MSGWSSITDTWTYSSTDNPTGVINWTGANSKVSAGMRIRFNNGGNTIYGIVTVVTSSTMTFLHEMNEADNNAVNLMANSAITNPCISAQKAPFGFPMTPDSWTLVSTGAGVLNTSSTSYVSTGFTLGVPIGAWSLSLQIQRVQLQRDSEYTQQGYVYLSSSQSSVSTPIIGGAYQKAINTLVDNPLYSEGFVKLDDKTTYYVIWKISTSSNNGAIYFSPDTRYIKATCAYL